MCEFIPISKWGEREDPCLQYHDECWLVNVEGILKLENHYFENFIVKIDSGKNYHWMLNIWRNISWQWTRYLHGIQVFSQRVLTSYKEENSNYGVEKLENTLTESSKFT